MYILEERGSRADLMVDEVENMLEQHRWLHGFSLGDIRQVELDRRPKSKWPIQRVLDRVFAATELTGKIYRRSRSDDQQASASSTTSRWRSARTLLPVPEAQIMSCSVVWWSLVPLRQYLYVRRDSLSSPAAVNDI